jgi:Kae1-associated kinase Bud32
MKTLFQGAEATISRKNKEIIKERQAKSYRHPVLDNKLRTQRTRKEVKLLQKASAIIKVPEVMSSSDDSIVMQEIKGKRLADCLDKSSAKKAMAKEIGQSLAKLHDASIIHGDLTTSNLMKAKDGIYFIDFGLGYESAHPEDKAVDLHVLKEALEAKHPKIAKDFFMNILEGYKQSKNSSPVIKQLKAVELRGRYKQQY